MAQGCKRLSQVGLALLCKLPHCGVQGCIVLLLHVLTHSCEGLVQVGLALLCKLPHCDVQGCIVLLPLLRTHFGKLFLGNVNGRLILLAMLLPGFGKGLTNGFARHFGQAVMLGDVPSEQLVLADDPRDELLVDLVLLLPETDALRYGLPSV